MEIKINVEWLEKNKACGGAVEEFKKHYTTDTEAVRLLKRLIQNDKFDWANWLIVRIMTQSQKVGYAVFTAERVIDLYEKKYPADKRPRQAIEVAKNYLKNPSANAAANAAAANAANAAAAANARRKMQIRILRYGINLLISNRQTIK